MKSSILALPLILTACSGGSSDPAPLLEDIVEQGGTCGTAYYSELSGDYDGQIEYASSEADCAWDVEMQVSTKAGALPSMCEANVSMTSELISGDATCGDVGLAGQLLEPFGAGQRNDELDNVAWPVDAIVSLNAALDADTIFPVGITGRVPVFQIRFDGLGNVTYPDRSSADESFSGVLVKQ